MNQRYSKERLAQMDNIEDLLNKRLTPEQRAANKEEAVQELEELKMLQNALSRDVIQFLALEKIGVPDLTIRLQTSTRQAYKIVRGEANLTLASLVELGRVLKRRPKIIWEDVAEEA